MHSEDKDKQPLTIAERDLKGANVTIGLGAGIGAFGAVSALAVGAVCPLCIVATPALLGLGLYQRARVKKIQKKVAECAGTAPKPRQAE